MAQELAEKRCEEMQRFAYEAYLLGWNECNTNKHGMMTFSGFLRQIWHKLSGDAPSNETIIKAERLRLAEEAEQEAREHDRKAEETHNMSYTQGAIVSRQFAAWLREKAR